MGVSAALGMFGCNKEQAPQSEPSPAAATAPTKTAPPEAPAKAPEPPKEEPLPPGVPTTPAPKGTAKIMGTVTYHGKVPEPSPVNRSMDPACGTDTVLDPTLIVNGGKVENAVVWLVDAPAGAPPKDAVIVDQKGCMYYPRIQVAMLGQKVMVRNSDQTLHNVHAFQGTKSLFNSAQPPSAPPVNAKMGAESGWVSIKCDVHPWMQAWVLETNNPWFAVTGKDGTYELKDVPAGNYKMRIWQEKLGLRTEEVKVMNGKVEHRDVSFSGPNK